MTQLVENKGRRTVIMHLTQKPAAFKVSKRGLRGLEYCLKYATSWFTIGQGDAVKKLNTHDFYKLATSVKPLTELEHEDGMALAKMFWQLLGASVALHYSIGPNSIFSPSLKRSAGALLRTMNDLGVSNNFEEVFAVDRQKPVQAFEVNNIVEKAKEFETVLANELPGLATYFVSQKGI